MGLGVGLDLPWGAPIGFGFAQDRGDEITPNVLSFLARHEQDFNYWFISWQPRGRNQLDAAEYFAVYDDLFERAPNFAVRGLHQTSFNLGALEHYDRSAVIEFTNALIERYGFKWVNEDLGLWSIHGRSLPYPLPPYLTDAGLEASIRNCTEVQEQLAAPLLVEFPGFSDGTSFVIGSWHGYDFFREVVEQSNSPATLDIGHLLSYQWLRGLRGEELYSELDLLPTDHCFEIHLSGCETSGERFLDYHHGILMEEQLVLLERLVPLCPNLKAITYEDPKFDAEGTLVAQSHDGFHALRDMVAGWRQS
ncbi:MAG TPA: hypothetical protein DIU15_11280 [Deltaproteobacteria bacterium]|nr:hypothetical protein [Deltaproteobacteria bacterium]HCP46620.1 hypothetical protein [Deltaproteobacteria bacterium]